MTLSLDELIEKLQCAREFVPGNTKPEMDMTLGEMQQGLPQVARVAIYGDLVRLESHDAGVRRPRT